MVTDDLDNHDTPEKAREEGPEGQKWPERQPDYAAERKALYDQKQEGDRAKTSAELAERRMNQFRQQVGPLAASLTPEQRMILAQELRKHEDSGPANLPESLLTDAIAESVTGTASRLDQVLADPHAQLNANEAAKLASAEAGVTARQAPIPERLWQPGEVNWEDVDHTCATIDGVLYVKVGDQWKVELGHVGGHAQSRWLSKQDAIKAGLEEDPDAPKADPDAPTYGVDQGTGGLGADPVRFPDHIDQQGRGVYSNPPHSGAQPVDRPQSAVQGGAGSLDQQGKEEQKY